MRSSLLAAAFCAALITVAPAAHAAENFGIDGLMSTVLQEQQSSISGFAIRARLHSAALIPNIVFMPTIEWWRSSSHVEPYGIDASRSDKTMAVDVRYEFHRQSFVPYAGAGLSLHFLSSRVDAPSLGINDATKSLTKGSLDVLGGVSMPLTATVSNFLELKYFGLSDYRQLKFSWGIAVDF